MYPKTSLIDKKCGNALIFSSCLLLFFYYMTCEKLASSINPLSSCKNNNVKEYEEDSDSSSTPLISMEDRSISNTHAPSANVLHTSPIISTTEDETSKGKTAVEIKGSKQSETIASTPKKDANLSPELENEIRQGNKQTLDRAFSTPFSSNVSLSNPLSPIRQYKSCKSYEKGGIKSFI